MSDFLYIGNANKTFSNPLVDFNRETGYIVYGVHNKNGENGFINPCSVYQNAIYESYESHSKKRTTTKIYNDYGDVETTVVNENGTFSNGELISSSITQTKSKRTYKTTPLNSSPYTTTYTDTLSNEYSTSKLKSLVDNLIIGHKIGYRIRREYDSTGKVLETKYTTSNKFPSFFYEPNSNESRIEKEIRGGIFSLNLPTKDAQINNFEIYESKRLYVNQRTGACPNYQLSGDYSDYSFKESTTLSFKGKTYDKIRYEGFIISTPILSYSPSIYGNYNYIARIPINEVSLRIINSHTALTEPQGIKLPSGSIINQTVNFDIEFSSNSLQEYETQTKKTKLKLLPTKSEKKRYSTTILKTGINNLTRLSSLNFSSGEGAKIFQNFYSDLKNYSEKNEISNIFFKCDISKVKLPSNSHLKCDWFNLDYARYLGTKLTKNYGYD